MPTSPSAHRKLAVHALRSVLLAAGIAATAVVSLSVRSQTATPAASSPAVATPAELTGADKTLLKDLAAGNRAEVQAGQLALEKSQNPEIRKFAQSMIDDHGKALTEVEGLALQKNVKLPDTIGVMHKTKELALKALSGQAFDTQYAKRAGVGDHESTVKLLKKIQTNGKDADLKALADKLLPAVEHHLEMARQLQAANAAQ
jgi:putative membrane protein